MAERSLAVIAIYLLYSTISSVNNQLPDLKVKATNVFYQKNQVTRDKRANLFGSGAGFRGCTIWLTGKTHRLVSKQLIYFKLHSFCHYSRNLS